MKNNAVARFTPLELAYHGSLAIPSGVLFCTGMGMLLQRLSGAELVRHGILSVVHQAAGVVLIVVLAQTVIVSVICGGWGMLLGRIRKSLSWGLRDIAWAAKVAFRTRLSPASGGGSSRGKVRRVLRRMAFVSGLIVYSEVPITYFFMVTFLPWIIASGLAMMFIPSALGPWIVHLALFPPASAVLALHLFRAFLYHRTRLAQTAVLITFGLIAVCVVLACGFKRVKQRAMSPGDLCADHAQATRERGCFACHRWFQPLPSSACLACHPKIERVRVAGIGYHGTIKGDCRDCHADHAGRQADIRRLDPATFNHQEARFALQGKHQQLACPGCHLKRDPDAAAKRMRYIGLQFDTCRACHSNPHGQPGADDCARCHTGKGWKRTQLVFDHDRNSAFPLDGRHSSVSCEACHSSASRPAAGPAATGGLTASRPAPRSIRPIPAPATAASGLTFVLTGVGGRCADCHVDPHRPTLGSDCQRCHNEKAWTGPEINFRHGPDSRFTLRGAHASLKCDRCHKRPTPKTSPAKARFSGTPTHCSACHADPHRGTLGKTCTSCHTENKWTGKDLLFQHGRHTKFALRGRHVSVACAKCHPLPSPTARLGEGRFAKTPTDCAGCHPDPHRGQLKAGCATCHSERGWKGRQLLFVHDRDSQFKIDAIHTGLPCAACHKQQGGRTRYRPLAGTCGQCHEVQAKALAGETPWLKAQADPHAGRVDCARCHSPKGKSPTPGQFAQVCRSCHNEQYRRLYLDWSKALSARVGKALEVLAQLRRQNAPRADEIARKIETAEAVGLHNIQLARKLLDDVLNSGSR